MSAKLAQMPRLAQRQNAAIANWLQALDDIVEVFSTGRICEGRALLAQWREQFNPASGPGADLLKRIRAARE